MEIHSMGWDSLDVETSTNQGISTYLLENISIAVLWQQRFRRLQNIFNKLLQFRYKVWRLEI